MQTGTKKTNYMEIMVKIMAQISDHRIMKNILEGKMEVRRT